MQSFDEYNLINQATLAMLRKNTNNNPDFLHELFQCFIDDTTEIIGELHTAKENRSHDDYYNSVHALKGLSGTIGCSRMFELLKVMDSLNKEKNFDNSLSYLPILQEVFDQTREAINDEIFKNS